MLAAACTPAEEGSVPPPLTPPTATRADGAETPLGLKWDQGRADTYRPYLEQVQGGSTFYELEWCDIEQNPGSRQWGKVDRAVTEAQQLGYRMYLKIRVGSCWATGGEALQERGQKRASAMPTDMAAYESFVRDLVGRYSAAGVRQYAVENEVNALNFWQGTPEEYEQLVTTAATAIRAADPQAVVFDAGISSTAYGVAVAKRLADEGRGAEAVAAYQRYYDRRFEQGAAFPSIDSADQLAAVLSEEEAARHLAFLEATFRLAQAGAIDAFQLHFYERWDNAPAVVDYVRANLPPRMPVEVWEAGVFWPGADDESLLAAETAKVVCLLLGAGVRRVIYLPTAFQPGGRRPSEIRWGLLDPTGTPRLAGAVYRDLAAAVGGPAPTWRGAPAGNVNGCALGSGEQSLVVLWSDSGARLAPPQAPLQVRSVTGEQRPWGSDGLELDATPVLVPLDSGVSTAGRLLDALQS